MDKEVVFIYLRAYMNIYVTIESKGVGCKKENMEKVCNYFKL